MAKGFGKQGSDGEEVKPFALSGARWLSREQSERIETIGAQTKRA